MASWWHNGSRDICPNMAWKCWRHASSMVHPREQYASCNNGGRVTESVRPRLAGLGAAMCQKGARRPAVRGVGGLRALARSGKQTDARAWLACHSGTGWGPWAAILSQRQQTVQTGKSVGLERGSSDVGLMDEPSPTANANTASKSPTGPRLSNIGSRPGHGIPQRGWIGQWLAAGGSNKLSKGQHNDTNMPAKFRSVGMDVYSWFWLLIQLIIL